MNAPRRLKLETRDPAERELLESWHRDGPSSASRDRAWSALATSLGAGVGVAATASAVAAAGTGAAVTKAAAISSGVEATAAGHAATAAATTLPKSMALLLTPAVKWLAVGALLSAAIAATDVVYSSRPSAVPGSLVQASAAPPHELARGWAQGAPVASSLPSSSTIPTPEQRGAPPAGETTARRSAPVTSVASVASVMPRVSPAAPASEDNGAIARQLAALDGARDALVRGDAREALRLLDAYNLEFPASPLAQEATVVRVRAMLASGDAAGAVATGRRFVLANPQSPYAAQIRQMLLDAH